MQSKNTNKKRKSLKSLSRGLKIIFKYLKEYKKEMLVLSVLGFLTAGINASIPYVVGRFFDSIIKPQKIFIGGYGIQLFAVMLCVWFVMKICDNILDFKKSLMGNSVRNSVYIGYTVNAISILLDLPLSFHKEEKIGAVNEKIDKSASYVTNIAGDIMNLGPDFLSIIGAFFVMIFINLTLSAILVAGLIVYIFLLFRIVPVTAFLQKKIVKTDSRAFGDAYDTLMNVQAVKQSSAESYEKRKLLFNFKTKGLTLWNEINKVWQGLNFTNNMVIMTCQTLVFVVSLVFILNGRMTFGNLLMFNAYVAMLFGPFLRLAYRWQNIQNGLVTIEETEKILESSKENYHPENAVLLNTINGDVSFKNAFFDYNGRKNQILQDISFDANRGEVIALVGESGTGKSTLVDLISGYFFAKKGKVLIDGHNIKNLDLSFLRSQIAVVPQEVLLFNDKIDVNIKYGNFGASDEKMKKAAVMAHCFDFIEKFPKKWKQVVGERGIKLSVGQKQRIAIARAILRDPKILILDEPTSALDAQSEKYIQESLETLMKGRTTFIIAHRLSTVRRADKILVIKDGKIAEQGKHDELLKISNGIYRNLYELQAGLHK